MIITQKAKDEIRKQAKFLKITAEIGGCAGFLYDLTYKEKIEDEILLNEFVITDKESKELIENIELDFIEEINYKEFKITNPKAKSSCGCGNSFG